MPLTDAKIRALHGKALKGEIVGKAADGGGLNFQNGKYWRMSYRFDGKQKTLALGVYPDISLKAAREARDKARTLLAQGIDPNEQKKSKYTSFNLACLLFLLISIGLGLAHFCLTGQMRCSHLVRFSDSPLRTSPYRRAFFGY